MFIKKQKLFIGTVAVLIGVLTFFAYIPALHNGFVNWDDGLYVYENQNIKSIDINFFKWVFTSQVAALWHPLTTLSIAIDYALWDGNPIGFHLTNIVLHALNTSITFLCCVQLFYYYEKPRKANNTWIIAGVTTAFFFGLHPLHVESVAWVSERKDLLCAFFYLLSILSYLKYAAYQQRKPIHYALCLISFILALMSKPMAVSLPIILRILDFYPLRRIQKGTKKILIEKIPLFALSILVSLVTIWFQYKGGALRSWEVIPLTSRIIIAIWAYVFYLFKILMPFNLAPVYPYPSTISFLTIGYMGSFILLSIISVISLKKKLITAVWLYYIVTLIPVIGIIQVGGHVAADRYTYLPSLGPSLLIGLGVRYVIEGYAKRLYQGLTIIVLLGLLGILATASINQMAFWEDSLTLWYREIKLFPDVKISYNSRGNAYHNRGDYRKALNDYNKAIEIDPDYAHAYYNRGIVYYDLGDYLQAKRDIGIAIGLNPRYGKAYYCMGLIYSKTGNRDRALYYFKKAESQGFKGTK